jgi:hypothetical protein
MNRYAFCNTAGDTITDIFADSQEEAYATFFATADLIDQMIFANGGFVVKL